jgi:divinyl protochlorophyllide a 8-vinyl-reductase
MSEGGPVEGRIGPNAVTRLAEALTAREGAQATQALFESAGLAHHLAAPPERMVEEADVVALHQALGRTFGAHAPPIARDAGERTARYLLANRIPRAVQRILRAAPPWLAARILLAAIRGNAWTFAGTGTFRASAGRGAAVSVAGGPFAAPGDAAAPLSAFYASVFETLFRELVSAGTRVSTQIERGACALTLDWRARSQDAPLPRTAQTR